MEDKSKEYKYILQYVEGTDEITYKFDANLNIWDLKTHLVDFLKGCGWYAETLEKIFKDEEE